MSFRSNAYATVGTAIFMLIFISLRHEENVTELGMRGLRTAGIPLPKEYRFPYQVSIKLDGEHHCSGSIVDDETVVTSAHCITAPVPFYLCQIYQLIGFSILKPEMLDPSRLSVEAGSIHRDKGVIHDVSQAEFHEDYNPITKDWNVAVLKLRVPFAFGVRLSPVALARKDDIKDGTNAVISGWSVVSEENGNVLEPDLLQHANLPVRNEKSCVEFMQGKGTERMLCAGIRKDGRDSCVGDPGSPLVSNGKLIGIALWDDKCGSPTHLGVYTKVSSVQEWIRTKMVNG